MIRSVLAATLLLLLSACATTPAPIAQGPFAPLALKQADKDEAAGTRVRWGGIIISVTPLKDKTCFEVLSRPLGSGGEPKRTDRTEGRFVACGAGFYDPAAYPAGREMTFVGTVQAPTVCRIGEYEHRCPRLEIESLHLWPKEEFYAPHYYCDPFWGPPWPYRYPCYPY